MKYCLLKTRSEVYKLRVSGRPFGLIPMSINTALKKRV